MGHVDLRLQKDARPAETVDAGTQADMLATAGSSSAPSGRSALFAASPTDAAARMFPEWLADARAWPADRQDARPEEKLPLGVRMLVMLGLAIAAWIPVFVLASLL